MFSFNKNKINLLIIFFLLPVWLMAQKDNPYGTINPLAPKMLADFDPLIGKCNCKSISKNQEGFWADTVDMTWTFKYIMDGMAVQDETIKEDGRHSGSIRQYNPDSSKWYVHYYSTSAAPQNLPTWEGEKTENGDIVLYNEQKAPNGTEGFYRLTFSNISEHGYDWIGEWVNTAETFSFPTWKIFCIRE
jgi:hypothetical protein